MKTIAEQSEGDTRHATATIQKTSAIFYRDD